MGFSTIIKSWTLDHFKRKKMSENAVKKLLLILMYPSDWYCARKLL